MSITETVKIAINSPDRFYIGGEWVKPSSPDEFDVINASTEDVLFRVAEAKAEDMDRAIAAAREAFDRGPWPRMPHSERAEYLVKIASALEARSADIGQIWSGAMMLEQLGEARAAAAVTSRRRSQPPGDRRSSASRGANRPRSTPGGISTTGGSPPRRRVRAAAAAG